MNVEYRLDFSAQAIESLRLIAANSPHLLSVLREHLQRLRTSPGTVSQPSMLPFDERMQMYRFALDSVTECVVLFRYGQDERTLYLDQVVLWKP